MNNEKLNELNILKEKIDHIQDDLESIRGLRGAAQDNENNCELRVEGYNEDNNETIPIDHDFFEKALTLQEKRLLTELGDLESEFEKL